MDVLVLLCEFLILLFICVTKLYTFYTLWPTREVNCFILSTCILMTDANVIAMLNGVGCVNLNAFWSGHDLLIP